MSNKRNIALFVASIGYGGTERVVSRLANELVKYYNVSLIVKYNNIELPIDDAVNVISLSNTSEHFSHSQLDKTLLFLKCIFKYQRVVKQNNIGVSLSFLVRQNVINGITNMFNPQIKTIISERCFPSKTYGLFGKQLVKWFYNKNDILFSNSLHINSDLQDNFNLKIPAHVIYNPIYTRKEKPDIEHYNKTNNDPFKIISVGRLNPVKNQRSLIKSLAQLPEHFKLNIYGVGMLEDELKMLSGKLNLNDCVSFMGNSDQIDQKILEHHCLVLTSISEGFPNVVLEAMSLGVPVIATDCQSGPLELLNDNEPVDIKSGSFYKAKYGLLVSVDDDEGLAKAISYYETNDKARKTYSERSFLKAKQYDISVIGEQMKELIDANLCAE